MFQAGQTQVYRRNRRTRQSRGMRQSPL